MKKFPYILSTAICALTLGACSTHYMSQADRAYDGLAYAKATKNYEKAMKKEKDPAALLKLAEAYRLQNEFEKAVQCYAKVEQLNMISGPDRLNYAKMLMSTKRYDKAEIMLASVLENDPTNTYAQDLYFSCQADQSFYVDTNLHTLKRIVFPELKNCFSAVPFGNSIVFAADRHASTFGRSYDWNGNSFLDLYSAKKESGTWSSAEPLKGQVNGKYHEGPAAFTPDQRTIYFTRTNLEEKKLAKDSAEVVHFNLYQAQLNSEGEWTEVQSFAHNGNEFSTGHPSLADNGNTMYFASSRPGGMGGTDIYRCRKVNGEWGTPEALGAMVNTSGNEMFPFFQDDALYFSSTGHFNMGGLDVFKSELVDGRFQEPRNLLYPLNSTADDLAYVLNKDGNSGYVTSSRSGVDQIYEFVVVAPDLVVEGTIFSAATGLPLAGVEVRLKDLDTGEEFTMLTGADGNYSFEMAPDHNYRVLGSKDGLFTRGEDVSTMDQVVSKTYRVDLELDEVIPEKPIVVENIYYDLDSWDLRPEATVELDKLVSLFTDNPHLMFELGSHTDSRASDTYNFLLSDMRAKSAVDYLIQNGVNPDMIVAKGYGESTLVNGCRDGVECSEEEHQANRRTEFKVLRTESMP